MMSSSGHVESSVEEVEVGSGGECGEEPRLLDAAGGSTGAGLCSLNNRLPPIVVVVPVNDSTSKPTILLNTSSSETYEIGLEQYNDRTCTQDSGDSNSQDEAKVVNLHHDQNATRSHLSLPHTPEEDEKDIPTTHDSSSEAELLYVPMSPDPLEMEPQAANNLPHSIQPTSRHPSIETEDATDSDPGRIESKSRHSPNYTPQIYKH